MDLETGDNPIGNQPPSAPNQQSNEPIFADSSGPFFTLYSKAAEDEDNKMVKSWQEDAKGILIFTGLFSATVAALVTVTVQDLRPNSQDTSAFYLGNIYEALADPNVTLASPVVKPFPFSPPKYAIWVNLFWFLSLVVSLSCALLATSLQQWARRYIRLTQLARTSPERRARMREFYAHEADKMHIPWAVEGLPTLLHISVFLFFHGMAIFLYNVNREVSYCVTYWILLLFLAYELITLLPSFIRNSPYYTPLSKPFWFLKASILSATFAGHAFIRYVNIRRRQGRVDWKYVYSTFYGYFRGMEKEAEETAEKQSSDIDVRILNWTIRALGDDYVDDDSQAKFFEAIPGLFTSRLVKDLEKLPQTLLATFWIRLDLFIVRTTASNLVSEEVKKRRVEICKDIASIIPCSFISYLDDHYSKLVSIDRLQLMKRWFDHESPFVSCAARVRAADILARIAVEERDAHWIAFAHEVSGLSGDELRLDLAFAGDNMLLATVIDTCRRTFHFTHTEFLREMKGFISGFGEFDIRRTLPRLHHDFCKLWNELIQEQRKPESRYLASAYILTEIRRHYISLHQGTDATLPDDFISNQVHTSSYPSCDIPSHPPILCDPPGASPHEPYPIPGGGTVSRHDEESIIAGSPSRHVPTTPGIIRDNSHTPAATDSHTTDESPPGAAANELQDISPDAMVSYTLRGSARGVPAGAASASASNLLLPTSYVINLPIPAVPSPSHVSPLAGAESITLASATTPSYPADNATPPRLRPRGLVNTGGVCFSNAVLQLLVHFPSFWDVFRELEDMKGQLEGGGSETATPLVDATVRFFEELMFKEKKPPPTQQPLQQAVRGYLMEDEEEEKEHNAVDSFEPTYMYDAMKEKSQLKDLLDGKNDDAEEFLRLYLDALDEELVELQTYISTVSALSEDKLEGAGQTEVKERDYMASSVKSPISRIFGGRSRKTVRVPSQPESVTTEAWRSLQLNIQPDSVHTIQDALARVSQPRSIHVVESSSSSSSNEATQEVLLEALPQILVLHLDRFMYDAATESVNTIGKPVHFGPELEIPLEIMIPAAGKTTKPMHYKLHGVLYHHDEPAGGRHYTVDVLHKNGESSDGEAWLHIDGEVVNMVRPEDVFGGQENERVDDGCVYMLFYCRTVLAKG